VVRRSGSKPFERATARGYFRWQARYLVAAAAPGDAGRDSLPTAEREHPEDARPRPGRAGTRTEDPPPDPRPVLLHEPTRNREGVDATLEPAPDSRGTPCWRGPGPERAHPRPSRLLPRCRLRASGARGEDERGRAGCSGS